MTVAALEVENITAGYHRENVLHEVRFALQPGEFVGIIGPNGAGKSTLIKCLIASQPLRGGSVRLFGEDIGSISRKRVARRMAYMPQEFLFHFPYSVRDFVMLSRYPYTGMLAVETDRDRDIVKDAMEVTGTWKFRDRSILDLSGGEKQRVVLASALAQDTDILLLDEPTSSLDLHFQLNMYDVIRRRNKERRLTVLAATHDLNLAALYFDRLILLVDGRIALDGSVERVISKETIREYFGVEIEGGTVGKTGRPYAVPVSVWRP